MTEVEKLRALLAEARKIVHTILDIDALHGWACESDGDEPALDDLLRDLRSRIDAALAEPVGECADCANSFRLAGTRERERDEAQAALARIRSFGTPDGPWIRGYERGYARGTEDAATAMREEAAVACLETHASDARDAEECAARIRALSIPKGMVRHGV